MMQPDAPESSTPTPVECCEFVIKQLHAAGFHAYADRVRDLITELREADEAAERWYLAASPYATPTALSEALAALREKVAQGLMAAERAYLRLLKLGDYEHRHSLSGQVELASLRDFIAAVTDKDAQMVQDEFEACAKLRECYWHWTLK